MRSATVAAVERVPDAHPCVGLAPSLQLVQPQRGAAEVGDDETELELVTCERCARPPRDPDDRASWAKIDAADVCPGCLTLAESDALRRTER